MRIDELMSKPVWQMTGEELMFLQNHNKRPDDAQPIVDTSRKYVYGCLVLPGCSGVVFRPPAVSSEAARLTALSRRLAVKLLSMPTLRWNSPARKSAGESKTMFNTKN